MKNIGLNNYSLFVSSYALTLAAILLFVYRNYRNKLKVNEFLSSQKEEIADLKAKLTSHKDVKSRFLTSISDELSKLLTSINSLIGVTGISISDDISSVNGAKLDLIEREIEKLQILINNVSEFSKLESGQIEIKSGQIDIDSNLKQMWGNYKCLAEQLNINYQIQLVKLPKSHLPLDIQKLDRALSNLLYNAIKRTPSGGKIIFKAKEEKGRLILQVIDTGIVVNQKNLPYIFEPYFEGSQTNLSLQEGMGLELVIAKEYIQLMESNLIATSKVNQGSSFTINVLYKKSEVEQLISED